MRSKVWSAKHSRRQAVGAPCDPVSWVAQVSNAANEGTFLTHAASAWGPGPLRGLAGFSWPNLLTNDARSLGQGRSLRLR